MTQGNSPSPEFDWYGATLDYDPAVLAEWLAEVYGGEVATGRGKHGYRAGFDVRVGAEVLARIWYGGQRETVHVEASGDAAPTLAGFLQADMAGYYRVTRVDSAYDFIDGDPWNELFEACTTVADYLPSGEPRGRRLSLRTVGDWLREDEGFPDGRTLYVGSPTSPVMARLYEKGKQLRKAFPDQADRFPIGWTRLELQWRPQKEQRRAAAELSPVEVWGAGAWSRDLHARVLHLEPERRAPFYEAPPDDARAFHYLVKQYGPLMRRLVAAHGWDGLRDELRRALD